MALSPGHQQTIQVCVNGHNMARTVASRQSLVDFLREDLRLTGTHIGCEQGACGACTILVDGAAVRSCLLLAAQSHGTTITTVEGLSQGNRLHPLQEAFHELHGLQCGFCTPGMLLTALALLREQPHPTETEVREALGGNFCRCTGYQSIVEAVLHAAAQGVV